MGRLRASREGRQPAQPGSRREPGGPGGRQRWWARPAQPGEGAGVVVGRLDGRSRTRTQSAAVSFLLLPFLTVWSASLGYPGIIPPTLAPERALISPGGGNSHELQKLGDVVVDKFLNGVRLDTSGPGSNTTTAGERERTHGV